MRIGLVLMASGFGARFGRNKLLETIEGVPLFVRAMEACPAAFFDRACAVSQYPELLALAHARGYLPVPNTDAAEGIAATVRLGVTAMEGMDGILFAVCDQPWLRRESVERIVSAFRAAPHSIAALSWRGARGNPCLFPCALFPELLALAGDRGGGVVIRAHPERLLLVEAGEGLELRDVDSPEDLAHI